MGQRQFPHVEKIPPVKLNRFIYYTSVFLFMRVQYTL